jgi:hypothetical protein
MTRLSATAIRDLASQVGLPEYLGEEIANSCVDSHGFADEDLVLSAIGTAERDIEESVYWRGWDRGDFRP